MRRHLSFKTNLVIIFLIFQYRHDVYNLVLCITFHMGRKEEFHGKGRQWNYGLEKKAVSLKPTATIIY